MSLRLSSSLSQSSRSRLSSGASGFTLLELLLATAVGAVVLLVINTTFFAALRLHDTTHAKIDDNLVVQRALTIIRQDLAGLMLPAPVPTTTTTTAAATTTPTTLVGQLTTEDFTATELDNSGERVSPDIYTNSGRIDGWTPFADVQIVCYYLVPSRTSGDTKDLVRVVTRNLLSAAAETVSEQQTLLSGVNAAAMTYYDGTDWVDTWDSSSTNTLPSAIRFTITRAPRDSSGRFDNSAPVEIVVPVLVKTTQTAQDEATEAAAP